MLRQSFHIGVPFIKAPVWVCRLASVNNGATACGFHWFTAVRRRHRPRVIDQAVADALGHGRDGVERDRTANFTGIAVAVTTGVAPAGVATTCSAHASGNIVIGAGREHEGKSCDNGKHDANVPRLDGTGTKSFPEPQAFNVRLAHSPSPPGCFES
jgi:hypothetical protein